MIPLKTAGQIKRMRRAGEIAAGAVEEIERLIRPGVSTLELDTVAERYITENGGKPSCKNYRGYPATICASIDSEVVHGIPRADRILNEGSLVSIDIVVKFEGFHADMARTFCVGTVSSERRRLKDVTEQSFWEAVKLLKAGARLKDISRTIQQYNESRGFSLIRALTGHGIGKQMHENPSIPNYVTSEGDMRLEAGMTLAIEPMVAEGGYEVDFLPDGWTVKTRDGKCAAHYENTVLVTESGYEILTRKG